MGERHHRGRAASPGIAAGPVVVLAATEVLHRGAGSVDEEAAALRAAMVGAVADLAALAERSDDEAAGILQFQIALLRDDELAGPALAEIAVGTAAHLAWTAVLDAEIAGLAAADDEYFRARTSDLADIRERVLGHLGVASAAITGPKGASGAVIVAADLPPSRFLAFDWAHGGAIVLTEGSPTSHVAMLARARGVPMVVGLGGEPVALEAARALVDGDAGHVVLDPGETTVATFTANREAAAARDRAAATIAFRPAATADGTAVAIHLNISSLDELDSLDPAICDGVGLVRTEFLFEGRAGLPDETAQVAAYRTIAAWAEGRPVTIRTLDAGGDKPIAGVTVDGESNPFLGVRGIRLSLRRAALFRVQLRALARAAAAEGNIRVMLPMVTVPDELAAAGLLLDEVLADLAAERVPATRPPLGIMVEVPAAALAIGRFAADFFSIGSNDLTQYATAAGRDIGAVSTLADPLHPGVLRLIEAVVHDAAAAGRDVSLCGDAGGDPAAVPYLLRAGLRSLSVAPAALARTKLAVAACDLRRPQS